MSGEGRRSDLDLAGLALAAAGCSTAVLPTCVYDATVSVTFCRRIYRFKSIFKILVSVLKKIKSEICWIFDFEAVEIGTGCIISVTFLSLVKRM